MDADSVMEKQGSHSSANEIRVWDPIVRYGHWLLVAGYLIAYFTEDDLLAVHVWAGYLVGAIVVIRVLWGLFGSEHARFSDFTYGPRQAFSYFIDLLRGRAKRYIGHSPAGAAMVFAMLVSLALTVWTGLVVYAFDKHSGPLASWVRSDAPESIEEFWEDAHETLANVTLALVLLHVGGVVVASVVHRENLVRAMINGNKRP